MRLGCCAALVLPLAYPAVGAPTAAEIFGTLPQVTDVVISPDGSTLAWQDNTAAAPRIVVFDVSARRARRTLQVEGAVKLRWLDWSDDATLLYEVSVTGPDVVQVASRYEVYRIFSLQVASGAKHLLLMQGGSRPLVTAADVLVTHAVRPHTIIMASLDDVGGWALSLYEVDTLTGRGTVIEQGTSITGQWVVDRQGHAVARADWTPYDEVYRVMARDGRGWREIFRQPKHTEISLEGLSTDGTAVIAISSGAHGLAKLLALPLDGSPSRVLVEDPQYDVEEVVLDGFDQSPAAARMGGARQEVRWFDAQRQQRHDSVARAFPGRRVTIVSESRDGRRLIADVETPSTPSTYYLVDLQTHRADIVGEEYPALAGTRLGEVQTITYAARDGTTINAYLTLPPGAEPRSLPLVVLPHGGPESRDDFQFDWWAQFLAARGYAVLQPEFRGSTGFGNAFRLAGRHQWGHLMQDDVSDGVRALSARGTVDPARVCIVGASYGGYAALAGAAFTPELYACAVSVNGVSNLPEMIGFAGEHSDSADYWTRQVGSALDPAVVASSPVKAAARVRAPVLLIYSADDTVVPPTQTEEMARALRENGKSVTVVRLGGDDHWLSRTDTRVTMLKELEAFLAAHLAPLAPR